MPLHIDIAAVLARVQVQDACTPDPEDAPAFATPLALRRHVPDQGRRLLLGGNHLSGDVITSPLPLALLAALLQHQEAWRTLVEWYEQRAGIGAYCGGLSHEDGERLAWQEVAGDGRERKGAPLNNNKSLYYCIAYPGTATVEGGLMSNTHLWNEFLRMVEGVDSGIVSQERRG